MDNSEYIGFIAGFCTTISIVPQIIKTFKTKSARNISLLTYCISCFGIILWIYYGIIINSYSIIIANIISFIFVTIVIAMKLKYK
jgi:MtN3 and saliva related transmembrane protein